MTILMQIGNNGSTISKNELILNQRANYTYKNHASLFQKMIETVSLV